MNQNQPKPAPQRLLPHEELYAADRAVFEARGYNQFRNRQAVLAELREVDEQRRRYNLS